MEIKKLIIIFFGIIIFGGCGELVDEPDPIFLNVVENSNASSIIVSTVHDKKLGDNMNINVSGAGGQLVIACFGEKGQPYNRISMAYMNQDTDGFYYDLEDNKFNNDWVSVELRDSQLYFNFKEVNNSNVGQSLSLSLSDKVSSSIVNISMCSD